MLSLFCLDVDCLTEGPDGGGSPLAHGGDGVDIESRSRVWDQQNGNFLLAVVEATSEIGLDVGDYYQNSPVQTP